MLSVIEVTIAVFYGFVFHTNICSLFSNFYSFIIDLLTMYIGILSACMFMYHEYAWYSRRSEEGVRSLGTALQTVVSYHVGTGNQTQVLWKSRALNC
jgi:purine-cytosine permease-like protein